MTSSAPDLRLPEGVIPKHYKIELSPDLEAATFSGTVTISVDIAVPLKAITLNAAELQITSAQIIASSGASSFEESNSEEVFDLNHETDIDNERLLLTQRDKRDDCRQFTPGLARLRISFNGILNDQLRGFYRSTYRDDTGTVHTIATTQFESTDARRAFPCFDEPALKTTFDTSLTVQQGLLAVSNTAEVDRVLLDDGRVKVSFATTMVMSTYLVAFVVGPLEATKAIDCNGVPVRVIHRPGRGSQTSFALDVAAHALSWFSNYYGLPYPSDKVDLVAIPDFAFGAMENLGCVTFREVLLLIDPDSASQSELQHVATVINHELAHMWFGDLVTMAWWEGIWLNEAFATFMETACSDAYRPDWKIWSTFCRSRASAFATDALVSTRPVEYPVHSPAEAEDMFDVITYEKGAALVRMLEQYLGADVFRAGVRLYLHRHAYGNTVTEDLWNALAEASDQPVREIMDNWIHQGGYPAVAATVDDHGVNLSQRHFALNPEQSDQRIWSVPLRLRFVTPDGETVEQRLVLDETSRIVTLSAGTKLVTVNSGASGFYREDLSAEALAGIISGDRTGGDYTGGDYTAHERTGGDYTAHERTGGDYTAHERTANERHGLIDDAWAATVSGGLDAANFVDLILSGFAGESDLTVWQAITAALTHLRRLVAGDALQRFCELVVEVSDSAAREVGLDPQPGENDRIKELRAVLMTLRGTVGDHAATVNECRQRLDHDDPTLAAAALSVVAAHGDSADFAAIKRRFESASNPQSEQRNLFALADFRDKELVCRILEETLDGSVRTQDGPYLIRRAMFNPVCSAEAWGFLRDRWDQILDVFPANYSWARMLEGITALDKPELAKEVRSFLLEHPPPAGAKQLAQHTERLDINLAFRLRESGRFSRYLLNL